MKSLLVVFSYHHNNTEKVAKDHLTLREKLQSKGYTIVDEFACRGLNTNSFMKYLEGLNKGRTNAEDLKNTEEFAQSLMQNLYENHSIN